LPSLWFVVPVYGREQLTRICLRQLRNTCDSLHDHDIEATAVVIGDDDNLDTARNLGFGTVRRGNQYVSKKFNDGIQLALDQRFNPRPADYVVPLGSDDWIDWRTLLDLPDDNTVVGFQKISFVRDDGLELHTKHLAYPGGSGIRIYPRRLMEQTGFRPASEDLERACDTSILNNTTMKVPDLRLEHRPSDPRQIVDWKSTDTQLNHWATLARHTTETVGDPFEQLEGYFPARSLREMADHYARTRRLAVA